MVLRLMTSVNCFALLLAVSASNVKAYDESDTYSAIDAASAETGVAWSWLRRVVDCETGGTMAPDAVGDHGTSLGAAQLHRGGELERFYAAGYSDPMNPYEALTFMAYQFKAGNAGAWSCK